MAEPKLPADKQLLRLFDNASDRRKARRLIHLIRADTLRHARRMMGEAAGYAESNVPMDELLVTPAQELDGG